MCSFRPLTNDDVMDEQPGGTSSAPVPIRMQAGPPRTFNRQHRGNQKSGLQRTIRVVGRTAKYGPRAIILSAASVTAPSNERQ